MEVHRARLRDQVPRQHTTRRVTDRTPGNSRLSRPPPTLRHAAFGQPTKRPGTMSGDFTMIKIGIILGSTRPNRVGAQVATWVHEVASARADAEFELVDLR